MRQSVLIAGLERSGKTYFAEGIAAKYVSIGKTAVLYNAGNDKDFSNAEICNPVTLDQMVRRMPKSKRHLIDRLECLEFFEDEKTGKIIPFKLFRKFYAGKMVKIYAIDDERYLFESFFRYVFDTLIIFDDFGANTRHGLSSNLIRLCSRKNHAGHKYCNELPPGIDTFFIYHSLDTPPPQLYNYLTRIVLFRLNSIPEKRINNEALWAAVSDCIEQLKSLPKYSHFEILLRECENIVTIKNTN